MAENSSTSTPQYDIWCNGFDHHRAPVDLRERLSISEALIPEALEDLANIQDVSGAVVLSTCNRLDIYAQGGECANKLIEQFSETAGFDTQSLRQHAYTLGDKAINHLFRVAANLESMVVGEYQIVHQIKQAHKWGREHGSYLVGLDRMFQHALTVAKYATKQALARIKSPSPRWASTWQNIFMAT